MSINYKNSEVDFRKHFAFSREASERFIRQALREGLAESCVLLCTCGRTEIYFDGDVGKMSAQLARFGGISVEKLAPKLMIFAGDRALTHLFSVACGIDSQVIGEDEILGQTKSAFAMARECGTVGSEFNIIFQGAITCAKKIKTRTALSKTSVSTATLASNEASRLGENVNVLVIGATGKIGSTVVKNLISHKNISVTATVRSRHADLQTLNSSPKISTVDYSDRYACMDMADCVISATSSPHYTVTAEGLRKSLKTPKKRLFIDLAVPQDIDGEITKIQGASLIGIDYFTSLAKENNALKMDSVETAKEIIAEDIDLLKKDLIFHGFIPRLNRVKSALEKKSAEELIFGLKSALNAQQLSAVLNALDEMGGAD